MTTIIKSNVAYSGSATLSDIAVVTHSASDIYTAYAARVVADGGTVQDAAACLAAITAAIAGNYFYKSAIAISASWGTKVSGGNISKFYNLVDSSKDGVVTGTLTQNLVHAAWATALFDGAQTVTFTAVNVNKAGIMGFIGSSVDHSATTNGLYLKFTPAAERWDWHDTSPAGQMSINTVSKIAGTPDFGYSANAAVGLLVEQSIGRFSIGVDGVLRKVATASLTTLATNVTADVILARDAGNAYMSEVWYMNNATFDTWAAGHFDIGARY